MFQTRSTLNLLHGTPTGLAILPDHQSQIALARVDTVKRAAFLAVIRKRIRALASLNRRKQEDPNG